MSKVISAIVSIILLVGADRTARFWKHLHAQTAVDMAATMADASFDQISLNGTNPIYMP